jgi:hypothetical protein
LQALLLLDQRLDSFTFVNVLDDGFVSFIFVVEDFGVLEVLDQARKSLQSGVCQHANLNSNLKYLVASELYPSLVVESLVKLE